MSLNDYVVAIPSYKRPQTLKNKSLRVLQEHKIDPRRIDIFVADKEQEELDILNEFLPTPLSEAEMSIIIDEVIDSTNATSMSDMGKVMGIPIAKMEGRGDGALISKIVKDKLS